MVRATLPHMRAVGIRELQQHASAVVRDVAAGEIIEITQRGRVVARMVPPAPKSKLDQLIEAGLAHGDGRGFAEHLREFPPEAPLPGERPLSEVLAELRADER